MEKENTPWTKHEVDKIIDEWNSKIADNTEGRSYKEVETMNKDAKLISDAAKVAKYADEGLAQMCVRGFEAGSCLVRNTKKGHDIRAFAKNGIDWRVLIIQVAEFLLQLLRKWILG